MGLGSCARICPVGAIEVTNGLAVVHPDLCIGCGRCVATCPRRLIKMVPEDRAIHVLCTNRDRGPEVKKVCTVGCIGCTLCVKTVAEQGIRMDGALAVVDYATPLDNEAVIAKCPMHTIVKRAGTRGGQPA
jgi:Fe-S-cluster-containing hydrogenase component 2